MGGYAQFCIRTLIGWLKTIASQMWVLFSGQNSGGLLGWVSNHWKVICIGLCVVGTLADLTVYIFRWEPIKVWKSYFRRRKNKNHVTWTDESELSDTYQDYSHETDYPEDHPYHKEYQPQPFQNNCNTNIAPAETYKQPPAAESMSQPENAVFLSRETYSEPDYRAMYRRPESQSTQTDAGSPVFEEDSRSMTEINVEKVRGPRRRRIRVNDLFSDPEDSTVHYEAPQPVIDQNEAYHAPVYPRNWKANGES